MTNPQSPDIDIEWKIFQGRLVENSKEREISKSYVSKIFISTNDSKKKFFSNKYKKYVFFIRFAALSVISLIAFWFLSRPQSVEPNIENASTKIYEFVTNKGEKATIPLVDGSIVYLNADSKLVYPQFFDEKNRFLKLEGEGYFLVSPDINRPFIVQTGDKFTFVKGTEFNLKYRNNRLSVVVTKGSVLVYNQDSSAFVNLVKGELSVTTENGFTHPIKLDTRLYTMWRDNKLSFVETPLSEIIQEIERFYNVEIICKNKKLLPKTLTGYFDSNSLDEILIKIGLALDFKFQRNGRKILIF